MSDESVRLLKRSRLKVEVLRSVVLDGF